MSAPDGGCAVVTGGTRGIGAAVAERLRERRLERRHARAATAPTSRPTSPTPRRVDARLRRGRGERFGPVLVLVNNAGHRRDGLAIRMSAEDWDSVVDTNLSGAFHCTRRALDDMLSARWGRIVNVSSVVAERANPGQANYAAAQGGPARASRARWRARWRARASPATR